MNWRPKDWDELKVNAWGKATQIGEQFPVGFEAGADAMLDTLQARGFFGMGKEDKFTITGASAEPIEFVADCNGKLALIPIKEEP